MINMPCMVTLEPYSVQSLHRSIVNPAIKTIIVDVVLNLMAIAGSSSEKLAYFGVAHSYIR